MTVFRAIVAVAPSISLGRSQLGSGCHDASAHTPVCAWVCVWCGRGGKYVFRGEETAQ